MRSKRLFGPIRVLLIALAILLIGWLPAVVAAETASEKAAALLDGLIKTNDPGLAVLVAQDGKILFEKSYGKADREHHVPASLQTTFRIASVTKQFTASAILKLQEQGKLSVDDKLSKYVPDFPRGDEVTLRQLLNHTSGIYSYNRKGYEGIGATNHTTVEALIEPIKKQPYDFDPGTQWRYDNSGYLLLGYIVEKVSGQSYDDFLRENFFQPLGMTNTGVYRADLGLPHDTLGYTLGKDGLQKRAFNWDPSWTAGNGALYSTVEDLYRWNEGVFNGRALDAVSLKEAFTPVKEYEHQVNSDGGYGFGWFITRYHGLRMISHSGGFPGFSSFLLRVPDEKFTVVVLANTDDRPKGGPARLAFQMVNIFLKDKLALPPMVNTNVLPNSYDDLTGRYDLGRDEEGKHEMMIISKRGPHLFGQWNDMKKAEEMVPESETEFYVKGWDAQITFVKDGSGKVGNLILSDFGIDLSAPRVQDIAEH